MIKLLFGWIVILVWVSLRPANGWDHLYVFFCFIYKIAINSALIMPSVRCACGQWTWFKFNLPIFTTHIICVVVALERDRFHRCPYLDGRSCAVLDGVVRGNFRCTRDIWASLRAFVDLSRRNIHFYDVIACGTLNHWSYGS